MRAASCSGLSTTTIWIVEQFGLAMIPLCAAIACALTSGTTSGTAGSMRKAFVLSMQTAPARAATGQNCSETLPPAEKSATCTPAKESSVSSCTA